MSVELSFWQEYGPRLVLALSALTIGGVLALIGGGAARAYERTVIARAEQYRSMPAKRRREQKDSYLLAFSELAARASKARVLQSVALYVVTAVVVTVAARTALDLVAWAPGMRWLGALAALGVALVALTYALRRAASSRSLRLAALSNLTEKGSKTA